MTDHDLLLQFITRRDDSAFRRLVERHTPWLYSVCLRRLRDPALAEDATQAVFLALAQKAPSLLHEPTLSPWLQQVAKYVAANILRANARRARHESEAAAMTPPTVPPPSWQEIESDLEPALDRLPAADRQVILLRFYEQKSHPEIAALLHISEAAAAKRLERALTRLRAHLAPTTATTSASLSTVALANLLHTHTVLPLPATLAASTAAASASTAALAKGALLAMATAKLQTALVIIAACLLITIPAVVVVVYHNASPVPAANAVPETALTDFLSYYALKPGENIKVVPNAPPEIRAAMFNALQAPSAQLPDPHDPAAGAILFDWNRGHPQSPVIIAQTTMPLPDAIKNLAALTLNLNLRDIDISPSLPNSAYTVPGDVVYDSTLPSDQALPAFLATFEKQLNLHLKCTFQNKTIQCYVLRGQWTYSPALHPDLQNAPRMSGKIDPLIEIYGSIDLATETRQTGSGVTDPAGLASQVSDWIDSPLFIESPNLPRFVGWRQFEFKTWPNDDPSAHKAAHDPTAILNHLTEQTGLTWSKETRTIRHLFIEPAPPPRDPFDQTYALAPGELIKHIPDAPAEIRDPFIRERFGSNQASRASLFLGWSNDTMGAYGFYGARRYTLAMLAEQILAIEPLEIEGNLAKRTITGGDFSYSGAPTTTPDQLRAALQKILQDDFQLPVSLQFRDVPRKIIVLRGNWKFTPTPDVPATNSPTGPFGLPISCVDIYGGDHFDKDSTQSGSGSGPSRTLANNLSSWIDQQVVIEATGVPPLFGYRCHDTRSKDPEARSLAHDRDSVLKHITDQTALTWSEETRTVRRLFIESQ